MGNWDVIPKHGPLAKLAGWLIPARNKTPHKPRATRVYSQAAVELRHETFRSIAETRGTAISWRQYSSPKFWVWVRTWKPMNRNSTAKAKAQRIIAECTRPSTCMGMLRRRSSQIHRTTKRQQRDACKGMCTRRRKMLGTEVGKLTLQQLLKGSVPLARAWPKHLSWKNDRNCSAPGGNM